MKQLVYGMIRGYYLGTGEWPMADDILAGAPGDRTENGKVFVDMITDGTLVIAAGGRVKPNFPKSKLVMFVPKERKANELYFMVE